MLSPFSVFPWASICFLRLLLRCPSKPFDAVRFFATARLICSESHGKDMANQGVNDAVTAIQTIFCPSLSRMESPRHLISAPSSRLVPLSNISFSSHSLPSDLADSAEMIKFQPEQRKGSAQSSKWKPWKPETCTTYVAINLKPVSGKASWDAFFFQKWILRERRGREWASANDPSQGSLISSSNYRWTWLSSLSFSFFRSEKLAKNLPLFGKYARMTLDLFSIQFVPIHSLESDRGDLEILPPSPLTMRGRKIGNQSIND